MSQTAPESSILLLGATFATDNHGVSILAAGAVEGLRSAHPGAQVKLLDYGREARVFQDGMGGETVAVPLVPMRFSWRFFLPNNAFVLLLLAALLRFLPRGVRARLARANKVLAEVSEADYAVALSGGDSFSDIYGFRRLLYVSLPQAIVLLMRKPLVLLPQTMGPFSTAPSRSLARWILRRARQVYARDPRSVAIANELLGARATQAAARLACDVGFLPGALPCPPEFGVAPKAAGRVRVGLNVSGLLAMGGYGEDNSLGLQDDYLPAMKLVAETLLGEPAVELVLIPHVFGAPAVAESDETACQALYQELAAVHGQRVLRVAGRPDHRQIKGLIGTCDFMIGARMHVCIAALSQGVPAVGLAYSDKFAGVLGAFATVQAVCNLRALSRHEICDHVLDAFHARRSMAAALQRKLQGNREQILQMFTDIREAAHD